jgi:short-subunit dehydrogenase
MAQSQSHAGMLSVVTGASTGIGRELAKCCAADGMDLLIVADEPEIEVAAQELRALGRGRVETLQADLATTEGVDRLIEAVGGRPVEHLIANAGRGLGKGFLDQDWADARRVVDTNITGTIYLIHELGGRMRDAGRGRILITGSIAGFMPGSYQAVYNATKAFLDSFSYAIREEIKDSGVTVTCLMPGATDTEFFERADLMDTKIGTAEKMDPADVARQGYDAMMEGEGQVITGWKNKMQAAMSHVMPAEQLAKQHSKETAPGTAKH